MPMNKPLPSSLGKGLVLPGWGHSGQDLGYGIFNPTGSSSVEQFPGDSYSNIRKASGGSGEAGRGIGRENLSVLDRQEVDGTAGG
jgi:hypothetical protein